MFKEICEMNVIWNKFIVLINMYIHDLFGLYSNIIRENGAQALN